MEAGASSIERVFSVPSVDNLASGLWRLQANTTSLSQMGMGRTDSEAAFQEFLKRIPSASNLAAIAGSTGGLDSVFPPSATNLLPTSAALAELTNGAGAACLAGASAGYASNGIPRVSSIDYLTRIVTQPGAATYASTTPAMNGVKAEAQPVLPSGPAPLTLGIGAEYLTQALPNAAALQGVHHPAVAINAAAAHHSALAASHLSNPAAAAAAALQLQGQLGHLSRITGATSAKASSHTNAYSGGTSHSDDEGQDKNETRRARRMLSNRESARRSRKRKQEHLSMLETKLATAEEEKKMASERANSLERRCTSFEEENRRLKEENERLRDELKFLRSEFRSTRRSECMANDDDDSPPAKQRRGSYKNNSSQRHASGAEQRQDGEEGSEEDNKQRQYANGHR